MKRTAKKFMIAVLLVLFTLSAFPTGALAANDLIGVRVDPTYDYSLARAMLPMINDFRTGGNAWYWNSDNTTKTTLTNLKPFTYDYGLESVAMLRAAELAVYYSHTRPDGTSCFTAYPNLATCGENIAMGYNFYYTTQSMFDGWKEEDEPYMYQGHRRNMLSSSFSYVGVGCVKIGNMYFWAQEFSSVPTGSVETPSPITVTASASILAADGSGGLSCAQKSITLKAGESAPLPELPMYATWGTPVTVVSAPWKVSGDCAVIKDNRIQGVKAGTATLTCELFGEKVTVNVTVTGSGTGGGTGSGSSGSVLRPEKDGSFRVYTNGKFDSSYNGMISYEGQQFFIADGVLQDGASGLTLCGDRFCFLANGRLVQEHTGFASYDGQWFFLENGLLDLNANGIYEYDGGRFLIAAGRKVAEYSGLWQNSDGQWLYLAEGQVVDYTGLALYDGAWFYVVNGVLAANYSGYVRYNGSTFYVDHGMLKNG